jgi:hypothetical protein
MHLLNLLFLFAFQTEALSNSEPALDNQWGSVVQITTEGLDPDQERVNSYCVATFLNPQVLVTAAHCVSHAYLIPSNQIKIELGQYEYRKRPDGSTFRLGYIVKTKIHQEAQFFFNAGLTRKLKTQKWKTKISPDEDLALVVLKEPIQQELYYFEPFNDIEIRQIKKNIQNYAPTVVTINFISEMSLDTKRAATLNQLKASGSKAWSSKSLSRLDPGDSGSPLFARTGQVWKLIGVSKGQAKTLFSDWDVFASFETNLCEISKLHTLNVCN